MKTIHALENWLSWMDELSDKNYVVIDDFLQGSLFETIQSFFQNHLDHFEQAGIGALDLNQIVTNIRGDQTFWLSAKRDTVLKPFWELVDEMIHMLNRYCFLSLSGFEFHLAHYPEGSFYQMHLDQFKDRNNRMISVVIYLNRDWHQGDGGELRMIDQNKQEVLVAPLARRCVLFKSADVPHEVLLSNKGRSSLTGWLLYHPASVGPLLG